MRSKAANIKPYGDCHVIECLIDENVSGVDIKEIPEHLIRNHIATPYCPLGNEDRYDEPLYPQTEQYQRFRDDFVCLVDLWNQSDDNKQDYLLKKAMITHIINLVDIYQDSFNAVLDLGSIESNRGRPAAPLPLSLTAECRERVREIKAKISLMQSDKLLRKLRNKVASHNDGKLSRQEANSLQIHVKRFQPYPYIQLFRRWHNYNGKLPIHGWKTVDSTGGARYHFQTGTIAGRWFGIIPGNEEPTAMKHTFRDITKASLSLTDHDLHAELYRAYEDPMPNVEDYNPLS